MHTPSVTMMAMENHGRFSISRCKLQVMYQTPEHFTPIRSINGSSTARCFQTLQFPAQHITTFNLAQCSRTGCIFRPATGQ